MSNSAYYISLQKPYAKIGTFKSQRGLNFKPKQRKHYGLRRKEPETSWLVVHVGRIRGTAIFGMMTIARTSQNKSEKRQH